MTIVDTIGKEISNKIKTTGKTNFIIYLGQSQMIKINKELNPIYHVGNLRVGESVLGYTIIRVIENDYLAVHAL